MNFMYRTNKRQWKISRNIKEQYLNPFSLLLICATYHILKANPHWYHSREMEMFMYRTKQIIVEKMGIAPKSRKSCQRRCSHADYWILNEKLWNKNTELPKSHSADLPSSWCNSSLTNSSKRRRATAYRCNSSLTSTAYVCRSNSWLTWQTSKYS